MFGIRKEAIALVAGQDGVLRELDIVEGAGVQEGERYPIQEEARLYLNTHLSPGPVYIYPQNDPRAVRAGAPATGLTARDVEKLWGPWLPDLFNRAKKGAEKPFTISPKLLMWGIGGLGVFYVLGAWLGWW